MPYRARGKCVQHKVKGKWRRLKCYTGKGASTKAKKYATALNMSHARKKGYIK